MDIDVFEVRQGISAQLDFPKIQVLVDQICPPARIFTERPRPCLPSLRETRDLLTPPFSVLLLTAHDLD